MYIFKLFLKIKLPFIYFSFDLFLKEKIKFVEIQKKLFDTIEIQEFKKLKKIKPNKVSDILSLNQYVRLKILKKHV